MKISKLFHWLYAFLMFLPIVLFIPNAFYYGFNEHATNTETTTINYKYQSNEVNSLDDLVDSNVYHFDTLTIYAQDFYQVPFEYITFNVVSCENIVFENISSFDLDETILDLYDGRDNNFIYLYFSSDQVTVFYSNNNGYASVIYDQYEYVTLVNFNFYCDNDFDSLIEFFSEHNYLPQYTDYNVIESVDINTDDTISNKMYQAWQITWNLPLLQWTHTSFVAQPFTYITRLFGVPSDSTLNYVFAYFVSISICWLVFDVIMYLPNLAHRWLDRGALE